MEKMDTRYSAIVLAAGSGSRMHSKVPKQYMELLGHPIIYYTLKAFEESNVDEVVLVVREGDEEYVQNEIVNKYGFEKVSSIVIGGNTRTESVFNGISEAKGEFVLIHDGARCFVSVDLINKMAAEVENGSCIAAVPSKDTIKTSDEDGFVTSTPDRSAVWVVQTPQAFNRKSLISAYNKIELLTDSEKNALTDDSMIMEFAGEKVRLIPAEYSNIKVTTPIDLEFGKNLIKK